MPLPAHPRNEPCPCGSGLSYKFCHQAIEEAPDGALLDVSHREYASDWAGNAEHYRPQKLYEDLADELAAQGDIARVLDIGCGLGHGLEALKARLPEVGGLLLGLDENPQCLTGTAQRLGLDPNAGDLHRITQEARPGRTYDLAYQPGRVTGPNGVGLVQSDLLLPDQELAAMLDLIGPFDAVTLWFTGIHKARPNARLLADLDIHNDADHRLTMEDAVRDLASERLRPGGWLHVVNRGAHQNEAAMLDEFNRAMQSFVLRSRLTLVTSRARPYTEPTAGRRIGVRSLEFDGSRLQRFAVSALFRLDA